MMIKIFFFSSLALLNLIISSSKMSKHDVMRAYCRYLNSPTRETNSTFGYYALRYYNQSPIDCLKLYGRYQDWVFRVMFWKAIAGPSDFIHPKTIIPGLYPEVLRWISQKIKINFLNYSRFDESIFKTRLELISLMIKLAEKASSELKSLGNNDKLISSFDDLVAIWKYLIRNISFDFDKKTIDYCSLSRTINEIRFIVKRDSSSNSPSFSISKRYALLWFYLRYIYLNDCTVIFDTRHRHRALISYLIMKFWDKFSNYYDKEFYPDLLRLLFEKIYNSGSLCLNHIEDFLSNYSPSLYLVIPKKVTSFFVIARSLTEDYKRKNPRETWRIRALAELEAYLFRNDGKVNYVTISN